MKSCGLALVALAVAVSCGRSPAPAGETVTAETLPPVALVGLERLDPSVAEELRTAQGALEAAIAADEQVAARAGRLGMLALAYGLRETADSALLLAAQREPDSLRWRYLRARALHDSGAADASIAALREIVEIDPKLHPAAVLLAESLIEGGRPGEAADVARSILAQRPGEPAGLAALGRAELALGDPAAAAEHLESALAAAPEATRLHYPLGLAYRALGRLDEARRELARRGAGRVPLDDPLMAEVDALAGGVRVLGNRGNEAFLAGRYREAAEIFARAVEADRDNATVRLNLAAALIRLGQLDEGRSQLDQALRLDPDSAKARFTLGTLLARRGRDAEAVAEYRRAIASDPDHRDAHFNLANALRRLGRHGEAVEHYRRVVEIDPGNAAARYGHGLLLLELERWQEAAKALEDAHTALPADPRIANALSRSLAASPRPELRDGPRALSLAERLFAAERSLLHGEALAMALAEVGRYDEAVRQQEALLAAARQAGRRDLEPALTADLERYRRSEPRRRP